MKHNIKFFILSILFIFTFLFPLNIKALPLCECFGDVDCGPGYYCDETVKCASYEGGFGMCVPCDCENYGRGWHDAPFWEGCSDCNLNSQNWCGPCGEARAFCDGCLWDYTWNPFRDETYPGGSGHKCPGNPPVCASGQTECRTGEQVYECDSDRCGWHLKEDCDDFDKTYCKGGGVWEDNGYCLNGSCKIDSVMKTDCNASDTCVGAIYRDYYCLNNSCTYTDSSCDTRCDKNPNIPVLQAPPNNVWINYDPTFRAQVSDPDNEDVWAYFSISGYGDGWGSGVNSGGISERGPVNLGTCAQYDWQARAQDVCGLTSDDWTGFWRVKVDKDLPSNSISYPAGNVNSTTITVNLIESDACSGVNSGDVDVSIDGGGWQDYSSAVNDFDYLGSNGHCYKFRYRVKDNADNWSDFTEGGTICIDLSVPTCSINYPNAWINSTTFVVALTEDGGGSGISTGDVDIQSKTKDGAWSNWSDYSDTIDDFIYTGQHCYSYKFRYRVRNNVDTWSDWSNPGYITKIDTSIPTVNISYPTGTIDYATFAVTLTESDDCSGISKGEVDISINNGPWQDYLSIIDDFNYAGLDTYSYKFRYRVQDNAGNWSDFSEGGVVTLRFNRKPNPPVLIAPPNNVWINYDPTFRAQVSDPDNEDVWAYFSISGYGDGWGSGVNSGGISERGPVNLGTCAQYDWQARAQDARGLTSDDWSGFWRVKVDKDLPSNSISYPTGNDVCGSSTVTLTEADACSGIKDGRVEISIDDGPWQTYASTINDFVYDGLGGQCYKFRYQVEDNAGNWSDWNEGAKACMKDCGNDYCEDWYVCGCDGNYIKECRVCHSRGCNNNNCYDNTSIEEKKGDSCDASDSCYAYDSGCEERDYSCSDGTCVYSQSNRHTDYYDSYETYCSVTALRKHRLLHDWYCSGDFCRERTSWEDDQIIQECGINYCEDWYICGCSGDFVKKCRICHQQGCNNGSCYDNTFFEEINTINCDLADSCVGTTYYDYYCLGGNCISDEHSCDPICEKFPNPPLLIAPPNNLWINYDPTFQAMVSDIDNEDVHAYFSISDYGDGWGNWVNGGGISKWGPVNLGTCAQYNWQAFSQDSCGFFNDSSSGYWLVKVDKNPPNSSINYPTGYIEDITTFPITLTESDDCSEIANGVVEVSIDDSGIWNHYANTIDDFDFNGTFGHCYKFHYKVQDKAGNWSDWNEGGKICLTPPPPTIIFTANPSTVDEGKSSTLHWETTEATSCTASGDWEGTKLLRGFWFAYPTTTTTYTLTCTNLWWSSSESVTVTVIPRPPVLPPEGLVPCGKDTNGDGQLDESEKCKLCHLFVLARTVFNAGLGLVSSLAIIATIIGAILILTARSSINQAVMGKKIIYSAITGVVIALGAWLFINSLIGLLAQPGTFIFPWNNIPCP